MAVYRALAQTTYKFVMETTITANGDISVPTSPIIGRIKVIENDYRLKYCQLFPQNNNTKSAASVTFESKTAAESTTTTNASLVAKNNAGMTGIIVDGAMLVDGVPYHGLTAAEYTCGYWNYTTIKNTGYDMNLSKKTVPCGKLKAVIGNVSTGTMTAVELDFDKVDIPNLTIASNTSWFVVGWQKIIVSVPKTSGDIVLALEIEYPKYDITLSGAGLQYSLDDGLTFANVVGGEMLEQVEHVVFKNAGTSAVNIGTTAGGSDVATISAGATYVAVPTEDGTWYIS